MVDYVPLRCVGTMLAIFVLLKQVGAIRSRLQALRSVGGMLIVSCCKADRGHTWPTTCLLRRKWITSLEAVLWLDLVLRDASGLAHLVST